MSLPTLRSQVRSSLFMVSAVIVGCYLAWHQHSEAQSLLVPNTPVANTVSEFLPEPDKLYTASQTRTQNAQQLNVQAFNDKPVAANAAYANLEFDKTQGAPLSQQPHVDDRDVPAESGLDHSKRQFADQFAREQPDPDFAAALAADWRLVTAKLDRAGLTAPVMQTFDCKQTLCRVNFQHQGLELELIRHLLSDLGPGFDVVELEISPTAGSAQLARAEI